MAVSVDTVYQTVLAIANKEQRGYLTPQEFNLLANQAQMEIFEQYFYDINQFKRLPGSEARTNDMVDLIQDKLDQTFLTLYDLNSNGGSVELPQDFYRLSTAVIFNDNNNMRSTVEIMTRAEAEEINNSGPLTKPRISIDNKIHNPIGFLRGNKLQISPSSSAFPGGYATRLSYYRKPKQVKWTYIVVNEKPLFNETAEDRQHFELHSSEESDLVLKILQYAGISIKEFGLVRAAGQAEANVIAQQKQ